MTQIAFRYSDRYSIRMEFTLEGARVLKDVFENMSEKSTPETEVMFDMGIISNRNRECFSLRTLRAKIGARDTLAQKGEALELTMEEESVDYARFMFDQCLRLGSFEPAELCEIYLFNRNRDVDIYCILVEKIG